MHAYCIIAHADPYCLQSLIKLIDDERNDIYIIFDKKTSQSLFSSIKTKKSKLIIPPSSELINIKWGNTSQIKAELLGFETALSNGNYEYIHLISGADLPIKNQNYIHDFFSKLPYGTNMIGFDNSRDYVDRIKYYYIANSFYRHPNKNIKKLCDAIRGHFLNLQKKIGFERNLHDLMVYKGTNWVSITPQFAQYLVDNKKFILKRFNMAYCPDELYKQTMIMNSNFRDTVYDMSLNLGGGTRIIDWKRGNPYVWQYQDFDYLREASGLFARKFDSRKDKRIIDAIVSFVSSL